jgi:hypothetical protein
MSHYHRIRAQLCWGLFTVLAGVSVWGGVPSPEKLLPDDTLILVTAPDFGKLRLVWQKLPQNQLWNDPAMKPFREDFTTKWRDQFIKPLERELDIKVDDYTSVLQGQLTFALIQNAGDGDSQEAGMVLLLDSKDKSGQLKKNLAGLRKKWVDSGKAVKTTKIREFEFTVVPVSTNDIPGTLRRFFPKSPGTQELGDDNAPKPETKTQELVIGQVDSLLVLSSTTKAAEKVVSRFSGGSVPPLSDVAGYQADHAAMFRDSPLYGWINLKAFIDLIMKRLSEKKENPDAPNPFDIKPAKILNALGIAGLQTLAFDLQQSNEGSTFHIFVRAPEQGRQGLFKILAGEARESRPPPFVPADVVKFQRWRIDGQKTWQTVQNMVKDVSPQWLNGINFLLETANTAAKQKDPRFDINKNLIGNLGNDVVSYQKTPRGKGLADSKSAPSLFLLGSPDAEKLAASLRAILVYAGQQPGSAPEEREFLGRKIYSVALQGMMIPMGGGQGGGMPQTLSYAASGGYVAFSSDAGLVEEYLRSSEGQRTALREAPGLADAAQKVTGPGSSLFGYENQVETTRTMFEALRKNPSPPAAAAGGAPGLLPSGLNVPATVQSVKGLMDFSLLPNFDSIAKYFYFTVYGASANVDGLSLKVFAPVPPGLRGQ